MFPLLHRRHSVYTTQSNSTEGSQESVAASVKFARLCSHGNKLRCPLEVIIDIKGIYRPHPPPPIGGAAGPPERNVNMLNESITQ